MMKHWKRILLVSITGLFGSLTHGQSVTGNWYANGRVQASSDQESYLTELILVQKGRIVKGELNYYFKDSAFTNKIQGSFDPATHQLTINKIPIIYYGSPSTRMGVDCPMTGSFTFRASKAESILSGSLLTDKEHQYSCPPINFTFRKGDSAALVMAKEEDKEAPVVAIEQAKPQLTTTSVTPTAPMKSMTETLFEKRGKEYLEAMEVVEPVVKIEIYDNGVIDNDSISLFFNNKLVLPKTMLSHEPITLTLPLDALREYNELSMFAENMGTIPPNTAIMILYDGKVRHEIGLSSDLEKSATIRLKRIKSPLNYDTLQHQ